MASLAKILYIKARFEQQYWCSPASMPEYERLRGKKKCLVFLAADYGNLGDVAITFAQERFLARHFPDYEIVDVPIEKTHSVLKALRGVCSARDIVTVVGGGNMSDLYFDIELLRQMVVRAFPDNRVILFPQTMFFSDTAAGHYLRRTAHKTYAGHRHLTMAARERWSFDAMRRTLPRCILVPDIVMTLDEREPAAERKGVTMCLRSDAETLLARDFVEQLRQELEKEHTLTDRDTHIGRGGLTMPEREQELKKIWAQFRSSQWVITDRLHGMIFAYITGTPAIVFANNNYKIEGAYSWIKECGYIFFIEEPSIEAVLSVMQSEPSPMFESVHSKILERTERILS